MKVLASFSAPFDAEVNLPAREGCAKRDDANGGLVVNRDNSSVAYPWALWRGLDVVSKGLPPVPTMKTC